MQIKIDKTDTLRRTRNDDAKRPRVQIFTATSTDLTEVLSSVAINHDVDGEDCEQVGGDHEGAQYKITVEYLGRPATR